MVIDSSALIAIVLKEPEAVRFLQAIKSATSCRISAATFFETGMVLKRDATGSRMALFEEMLRDCQIAIAHVTEEQARTALDAFGRYERGRGHAAGLNFGDCFSSALAKTGDEPLLFKGNDFIHTDIQAITA